jgi:hypothetical protein
MLQKQLISVYLELVGNLSAKERDDLIKNYCIYSVICPPILSLSFMHSFFHQLLIDSLTQVTNSFIQSSINPEFNNSAKPLYVTTSVTTLNAYVALAVAC